MIPLVVEIDIELRVVMNASDKSNNLSFDFDLKRYLYFLILF